MELHLLGAAGSVTGSRTLVTTCGANVLVDCGLFQGYKALRARNWRPLPFDVRNLDAVLLTHAHIDHSGYLPRLVKEGFRGPVWCTQATADLCGLLLPDSGFLQEEDARFANKRGFSKHRPAEPLYTEDDAKAALELLAPAPWGEDIRIGPLTARFKPAGHILGASMVTLKGPGGSATFTGDLGRLSDPLMHPPADLGESPDLLVLESTYGDRRHPSADPLDSLHEVISKTIARRGVVLIPAFAVGRAQAVLLGVHRLIAQGRLPKDLPVYLNSPMAVDATELYQRHSDLHRLSHAEIRDVISTARLVRTVPESQRLNQHQGPAVILSASGMLTGGRILHHLKSFAPDPKNTLLLVGFQAAGTRGAQIAAGAESVRIHGEEVPIACEVARIDSWSAHADADEILTWLGRFPKPPGHVLLNHGEPEASDALRKRIQRELGWSVSVAEIGELVKVGEAPAPAPSVASQAPEQAAPHRQTETDFALQSLGAKAAVLVMGGSDLPEPAQARRDHTRLSILASERPNDARARRALTVAERRVAHSAWIEQAQAIPSLISEHEGLALLTLTGGGLPQALATRAREQDYPIVRVEAGDLRTSGLPALCAAVLVFPGGLSTLATLYAILEAEPSKPRPIVLIGRSFWHDLTDSERLVREGLLEEERIAILHADDVQQAMALLESRLQRRLS